ncbi:MAG: GNVR domain-containing protein [Terriglobales bacterium]
MSSAAATTEFAPVETVGFQEQIVSVMELFWRSRRFLLRLAAAAVMVLTMVAFLITSEYESTVQLMPPDSQSSFSTSAMAALSSLPTAAAGSGLASSLLGGIKTQGATVVAFLESRTVEDDLINRFDLRKVYGFSRYVDTRNKLAKRTSIEEDRKSGVITLAVADRDRRRARDLAQAYVDELDFLFTRLSTSSARRERIFLEERLKGVKQELDDSSRQLSEFSSQNATFDAQNQTKAMIEGAARLQGELIAAESETRALEPIYGSENVRLRSAKMRVGELRRQLERLGGAGANGTSSEPGDIYPPLRQMPMLGVRYADLYRTVKIREATFEILTKQYEIARVEEAKELPSIKVLDAPDVPERKSFPPRLLIIVFGTFLTVIVGMAWVVIRAAWRRTGSGEPARIFFHEVRSSRF